MKLSRRLTLLTIAASAGLAAVLSVTPASAAARRSTSLEDFANKVSDDEGGGEADANAIYEALDNEESDSDDSDCNSDETESAVDSEALHVNAGDEDSDEHEEHSDEENDDDDDDSDSDDSDHDDSDDDDDATELDCTCKPGAARRSKPSEDQDD